MMGNLFWRMMMALGVTMLMTLPWYINVMQAAFSLKMFR